MIKAQIKTEKMKAGSSNYSFQNGSDDVILEMNSQLQMFTRHQLFKLIFMLSQEVARLEHQLQSLCNVNIDGQLKHSNSQATINEESQTNHSRTNRSVLQKFIQFIESDSHLKTKKSEDIKHQEHVKVDQFSGSEDSIANLNNEIDDDYESSCEHTDTQPLSDPKNVESFSARTHHNLGIKFKRKRGMKNRTGVLPKEKLLNSTCQKGKKLRNQKSKPVSAEQQHQVPAAGDTVESFRLRDAGKLVNREQESVQDIPAVIHHRCVTRSTPDEKVQPLEKNNKYKATKCSSLHSIYKIPSEESSAKHVLKISADTSEENQMFICCFCKAHFRSKPVLGEHMKTDHNCTHYFCIVCGKSFRYKHSLKAHQRGSHTAATVLCSHCGKLVLQTRLDMHMEKVHERPNYTCHICQKGFLKRECLEGHVNKHSNTKPYICEHCGRKYAYSTSLSSHRRQCVRASMPPHLQHPRSSDKCTSCVCEICGLKFEAASGLKDHLSAKHSNKVQHCTYCGKEFHWRPSYNRHIKKCVDRTDLERERCRLPKNQKIANKYYTCVCGKQYPYRQSFKRHERTCQQKQEMESSVTGSDNTEARDEVPFSENLSSSLQLPASLNLPGV